MVLSLAAKQRQGELESKVKLRDREMRGERREKNECALDSQAPDSPTLLRAPQGEGAGSAEGRPA